MDGTSDTAVRATMAARTIIIVGLRFYTRYYKKAGYKWDDWLILMALIFMLACDIVVSVGLVLS